MEELLADALGDAMVKKAFWRRVLGANPEQARSWAQKVIDFLRDLVNKVGDLGSKAYFRDINEVRKVLGDAFAEWLADTGGTEEGNLALSKSG